MADNHDKDADKRRDELALKLLNTPPKPRSETKVAKRPRTKGAAKPPRPNR